MFDLLHLSNQFASFVSSRSQDFLIIILVIIINGTENADAFISKMQ